jgi:hypothetical protein
MDECCRRGHRPDVTEVGRARENVVRDPQAHDTGLADLERCHGPAHGPPRVDRTGDRPGPGRHRGQAVGAHAQVGSAAELSIGRRIAGATRADVQHALWEDRSLVKTFGPRGTVHLLAAADLPMWTGALQALPSSVPAHPEPVRFSADQADEVIAAIGDALAGTELTVDELTEQIVDRTGRGPARRRWRRSRTGGRAGAS